MLGSILGAVAGPVIGGLFGSKKQKTVTENKPPDGAAIRKEALRGGFNPLTFLRATGGSGGGGTTTQSGGSLSSGSWIANAVSAGFSAWQDVQDNTRQEAADALKQDIMREELAIMKERRAGPKPGGYGFSIPTVRSTGVSSTGTAKRREQPKLSKEGAKPIVTVTDSINSNDKVEVNAPLELPMQNRTVEPVRAVPLTSTFNSGMKDAKEYIGLNPDAWEIGVGELMGGALVHGGSYLANKIPSVYREGKKEVSDFYKKRNAILDKAKKKKKPKPRSMDTIFDTWDVTK